MFKGTLGCKRARDGFRELRVGPFVVGVLVPVNLCYPICRLIISSSGVMRKSTTFWSGPL
jgi:hypothetical protein